MRDEAPVYYSEEHDFYALTRHEDVAPAFKDHETYSSALRLRPGDGAVRTRPPAEVDHLHGPARAPPHAQPAEQGVHARAPSSRRSEMVIEQGRASTSAGSIRTTSMSCRTSPARSPSRSSPRCSGVPEDHRQQVRHWIDDGAAPRARPGRARRGGHAGQHRHRRCSTTNWCRSGERTRRTTCSPS